MNHFHGHLVVEPGMRFGVAISRFNELIGTRLLAGFEDAIVRHGGQNMDIDVFWVPGAFELPLVAKTVAETGRYGAVACLGAVIRGATPHFDIVASESAKGIQGAMLSTGTPIINGVLTTDTIEQAIERAGTKSGNKGWDAGISAIEMANLMRHMRLPALKAGPNKRK